jgi:hypothetical protein
MPKPFTPADPFSAQKRTNHVKLWLASLLTAAFVAGIAYAFFAEFEHEPWFPPDLAQTLNRNEVEIFVGGALGLAVLLALVFYRTGVFSQRSEETGWGSGPSRRPVAPVARREPARNRKAVKAVQAPEVWPSIEVVMQRERRACYGDLFLTDRRLFFVCYFDESLAKAVGGQAVASQFGILGVLLMSLLGMRGSDKRRKRETEKAREELKGLTLEAQAERNPYGLNLTPGEITAVVRSTWTGTRIEVGEKKYKFMQLQRSELVVLKAWCTEHEVDTVGF